MKNNIEMPEVDVDVETGTETNSEESKSIILYNDDYNTFEHVIECLIKYCEHNSIQAEQCASIVHHNGKCSVKGGDYDKLKPIHEALLENGLNSKIE